LVDIGGIVNHHSMSWSERWFLLILVELLTSLNELMWQVNINKHHLSLKLIEWWSTIPPISASITSHFNSLSDGQQFHQYQQKSPLTLTHWMMVKLLIITQWVEMRGDFCWYWWNCWPSLNELRCDRWFWLILVELTNINKNHLSP
jgi:hypothetical protein